MAINKQDKTISTSASEEKRSLLDLPAEIWSKIGKHAIDEEPFFTLDTVMTPRSRQPYHQPALTRVCKSLRYELLPYYYRTKICMNEAACSGYTHIFSITPKMYTIGYISVTRWLKAIGHANRKNLRSLAIRHAETPAAEKLGQRWGSALELGGATQCPDLTGAGFLEFPVRFL